MLNDVVLDGLTDLIVELASKPVLKPTPLRIFLIADMG